MKRYYNTIKYLKWRQLQYQIYYRIRKRVIPHRITGHIELNKRSDSLAFQESIAHQNSFNSPRTFTFLNRTHSFKEKIDWNYAEFGKLWTYNLNYFEFLLQKHLPEKTGLELINSFLDQTDKLKDGLEPYPTSLRLIFWVRFITKFKLFNSRISNSVCQQARLLRKNLEYHLLGNHYLENGFALLFAAYFCKNKELFDKSRMILLDQLDEQILGDGAHFERSPMYHQLILYRLLDSINLMQSNAKIFDFLDLLEICIRKAQMMLKWLSGISFSDGSVPMLNDCSTGIAPDNQSLFEYAQRLGLKVDSGSHLKECGYRKIISTRYEMVVDIGEIGPDYIPGHAHSDTLSFVLYVDGKPFIVDTGTSTYERGERRNIERSTSSHNTVMVGNHEQSQIWGAFRVAKRAKPVILQDNNSIISAKHDGYRFLGLDHTREFIFDEKSIFINDMLSAPNPSKAFLHFHPEVDVSLNGNVIKAGQIDIVINSAKQVFLEEYELAVAFNMTEKSTKAVIEFDKKLETRILF